MYLCDVFIFFDEIKVCKVEERGQFRYAVFRFATCAIQV